MSFLEFKEIPFQGNTKKYMVLNISGELIIGSIRFYPQWRRYVFFPETDTLFDSKCMNEITRFLEDLMEDRKHKLKEKGGYLPPSLFALKDIDRILSRFH